MSKLLVKISRSRWSKVLNPLFIRAYRIDTDEMEHPVSSYKSIHHLFTRKLKTDARLVNTGEDVIISPVDGTINSFGRIEGNSTFEVKNSELDLIEMLGTEEEAKKFINGHYIIFYLSPRNYHRIHSPVEGEMEKNWTLGGKSYPVNRLGLKYGKRPLSSNYRIISALSSQNGKIAVVKVGALNVNSIHMINDSSSLKPGDDLAYFSFGSTVILLIENETFHFDESIQEDQEIQFGKKIGSFS